MAQVLQNLTATGPASSLTVNPGEALRLKVAGTFVGTVALEYSDDAGSTWHTVLTFTDVWEWFWDAINLGGSWLWRWNCTAYTSGTIETEISTVLDALSRERLVCTAGKVGATAGWVVAAADDLGLAATLPAAQTASTLVIPLPKAVLGKTIVGFSVLGQIESAGGAVTLDAELRRLRADAADVVDSSVASMTQLAVTADTKVNRDNAAKTSLSEEPTEDDSYYILITATTAAATDIALQGVVLEVVEP